MSKDLKLQLRLGVKDEGTKQSLDNVISLLKKLEQAGKQSGQGTAVGAKQAAEAIRVLKLETQQNKVATEAGKRAQIELKNALLKTKLAAQEERKEFQKLKNQLNGTNKSAETLKKTFGLLGTVISVGLVVKTFKDISTAAIEAAESENLFVVSLGNHVKAARQWSEELSKTLGLNAYEVRKNLGIYTVMLNSMGLAEDQAYDMGKALTKLSYDLASFYNLSNEEAFNKIKSGITGEAEPLKALGIILNETTVKQAAYTHGIAKQGKELTEIQKIQARYIALMEQTSKAQGDLKRTSDSASNQMKRMESTVKDLYITTGNLLIPTIQDLIKTFLEFVSALKEFVEKHGVQIQTTFEAIAQTIKNTIDTIFSAVNSLNTLSFGGFETAFNGVLIALNTASYIAAKLAKEIELLTAISKQSEGIPTENELYQKKLTQMGINPDAIPLEAQVNPKHPLYAKLQQAYALAKSEHVQLKYGDQNPHTKEIERLKREIGDLEKTWLETQKKLLIKPYQLNEELKKQNTELEEKLMDLNIGDGMVMPTTGTISSPYGKRKDPFTGEMKDHTGIDIANKLGTKIKAAAGGVVHIGEIAGYGKAVIIDHGNGLSTLYGHLNKYLVKDKQRVLQGDVIAEMGSTGRSTGSHLHFEVREKGSPVNPAPYLGSLNSAGQKTTTQEPETFKLLEKYENLDFKMKRLEELLKSPESFGLSQLPLMSRSNQYDAESLKTLGLTDQDIELIQSQAAKMFEGLQAADQDYLKFKEEQLKSADTLYQDYLKKLAEAQIEYELNIKEIKDSESGTDAQKQKALDLLKGQFEAGQIKIKEEYQAKIATINEKILDEDIKLSDKRTQIIEKEVTKQIELREDAHEKAQELEKATVRIYQDAANQKSLLEAQRSGDTIAILNAEAKIKADQLNQEIEDIQKATEEKLASIEKELEAEKTLSSTKTELEKEKEALIENSLAKIESLREEAHQNELDRIKKETEAYADQFEKRLGFLAKIFDIADKMMGGNTILSKVSGFIGSYSSTITDALKYLGVFNPQNQQSQAGGLFGWIKNLFTKGSLPTGTQQAALENLSQGLKVNTSPLAPFIKGTSENLAQESIIGSSSLSQAASSTTSSVSKLGSIMGSLMKFGGGAITGGITGFSMGNTSGPTGMLGGAASGAMTGFMLGGPIGAAIGGGVGLISGLFGWLFGRRLKKELKRINTLKDQFESQFNNNVPRLQAVEHQAMNAKYLDEFEATAKQIDQEWQSLANQEAQINDELNPARFKKKKARREAARIQGELIANLKNQQQALNDLREQNFLAKKARMEYLQEQEYVYDSELKHLRADNVRDPFTFNVQKMYAELTDIQYQYQKALSDFRDSPKIMALAKQVYDEQLKQSNFNMALEKINVAQNKADFIDKINQAHLTVINANEAEFIKAEKQKMLNDLDLEMQQYRLQFADNQEMLTRIVQYETDRRVNIEREAQEKIKQAYENTGQTLAELIQKRSEITNQFDFQRAKTRTQIIKDQLAEIDKQIKEAFPDFVKQIQSLDFKTLNSLPADQLAQIQTDLQKISNYSTTNEFNNIITINAESATPYEVAKTIGTELEKLLAAQRRFALP